MVGLTILTNVWRRRRGSSLIESFEEWCNFSEPTPVKALKFNDYYVEAQSSGEKTWAELFSDHVRSEIQSSPTNLHLVNGPEFQTFALDLSRPPSEEGLTPQSRSDLYILNTHNMVSVEFSGALIRKLTIGGDINSAVFTDCKIASLDMSLPQRGGPTNLTLTNCLVGRLELRPLAINNFTVIGGSIRAIGCPPPGQENPFTGSVTFDKKVAFPRSRAQSALFEGPQQYRALRAHLEKLENAPAASQMRALELAAERESDTGLTWLANWYYGTFADYGLASERPLKYAGIIYILVAGIIYLGDGGAAGLLDHLYQGWQTALIEPGVWSEVRRSLLLPLQSMVNPFGLFGARKLIVPATGWGQILLAIQGLACDILLATSVIAVRKRFKLH